MSANHNYRALIASSILLGALLTPIDATARGLEQWLQKGGSIIRSAAQIRNQAVGNQGYSHQSAPEPSAASTSPGSNYYNIDPSTMRVPGRHQQESPSEQPAYTPPPSSTNSYSPRSAYHTGSDQSDNAQTSNRMSSYTPASKMRLHAHAIKRIDKPERAERASVIVVHKDSKPAVLEKPEVLKQGTTSDTTWIIPTVDRLENNLRKGKS
jgi:hypothetical protein